MNLDQRQKNIVSQFSQFPDWEGKYRHLIEVGKRLGPYPEEFRNEDHLVKGCQSQVWLHAELKPSGLIEFQADSDALIVKGLAALLLQLYSSSRPEEILKASPQFVAELDLGAHLSPSRANGLYAMVKQIKYYATAFQALQAVRGS